MHWIVLNTRSSHAVIESRQTFLSHLELRCEMRIQIVKFTCKDNSLLPTVRFQNFVKSCVAESLVRYLSYCVLPSVWKRLSVSHLTLSYEKFSLRCLRFRMSPERIVAGTLWLHLGPQFNNLGFAIKSLSTEFVDSSASLTMNTGECGKGSSSCR